MTSTDEATPTSAGKQRAQTFERGASRVIELRREVSWEKSGCFPKCRRILLKKAVERRDPRIGIDNRHAGVHGHDCLGELPRERVVDAPDFRNPIERLALVETQHFDGPFDRLAITVEREPAT